MISKFAQGDNCLFPTREVAIEFLDTMLVHKFFHRAKKVPVTEAELKRGKKKDEKEKTAPAEEEKKEGVRKRIKEEKATDAESNVEGKVEKTEEKEKEKEKKKRKIRLDMHPDQLFIDGPEAYVWIYDPIPMHYWLFGALLVVGAIVICMFPLWPSSLRFDSAFIWLSLNYRHIAIFIYIFFRFGNRKGVYYLSIAAAGFLVFILGLTVLRCIVFCIVWVVTASRHHIWLFPNLTEDVGFWASFWPLYQVLQ